MENLQEPALSNNDRLIIPKGQLLIIEGQPGTGKSCLADHLASPEYDVQVVRTPTRRDNRRRATLTSVEQAEALLEDKEALANTILILEMDVFYEYSRQHHPNIAAIGSKYSELLHAKTALTILETRPYSDAPSIPRLDPLRKVEYCWFQLSPDQTGVGPSDSVRTDEENTVIRRLPKGRFLYRSAEGTVTEAHLDLGRSRIVPTHRPLGVPFRTGWASDLYFRAARNEKPSNPCWTSYASGATAQEAETAIKEAEQNLATHKAALHLVELQAVRALSSQEMSAREIATATGMSKSAVGRILRNQLDGVADDASGALGTTVRLLWGARFPKPIS